MKNFDTIKRQIKEAIISRLCSLNGVYSITFVGSFEIGNSISSISDIDIVIIVDHLSEEIFKTIINNIKTVKSEDCGLSDYSIILNTSFGPLKYNDEKSIVFHLMIYDKELHRKHVNESPFTCYDWELHSATYGKNLSEIYPVQQVQLSDLIGTRRSLNTYLDDLEAGRISYRRYKFSEHGISEDTSFMHIDDRHQKEYVYHIIKFLMFNTLKVILGQNLRADQINIPKMFITLDSIFKPYAEYFLELAKWKENRHIEPVAPIECAKSFISTLHSWLTSIAANSKRYVFFRHAKTELNNGRFLGQRNDPGIIKTGKSKYEEYSFDLIITSSLKRSIETGMLFPALNRKTNSLLNEIDYGSADGLNIDELKGQYPNIIEDWAKGEDPKFPDGENLADVTKRISFFVTEELLKENKKNTGIITHNVVLRTLLGKTFSIPINKLHLINIDHLESFTFIAYQNKLIPELSSKQRIQLRDQITKWTMENS